MPSESFYGYTFIALFAIVTLEVVLLRVLRKKPIPWRDVAVNMNSGQLMLWTMRGLRVLVYGVIAQHASLSLFEGMPTWAITGIAFVLWDVSFYTSHWAHHRFPFLWSIHAVHHQGSEFNISLAVRNSWFQVLTPAPFFLVLAVAGIPVEIYLSVGAVHYIIQLYNHNGITKTSGWLDYILITPTHHRLHHAMNPAYLDRNFGSALLVWDKLFGTFAKEREDNPVQVGMADAPKTQNAFWLNTAPFLRWFGITDPDFMIPKVRYDYGDVYIFVGSLLQFMLMSCYIVGFDSWGQGRYSALFVLIFAGTTLLGGVADGRRMDLLGWISI